MVLLSPWFRAPEWRGLRLASCIATGMSAFAPIGHAWYLWGTAHGPENRHTVLFAGRRISAGRMLHLSGRHSAARPWSTCLLPRTEYPSRCTLAASMSGVIRIPCGMSSWFYPSSPMLWVYGVHGSLRAGTCVE